LWLIKKRQTSLAAGALVLILIVGTIASPTTYVLLGTLALISVSALGNNLSYIISTVIVVGKGGLDLIQLLAVSSEGNLPAEANNLLIAIFALIVASLAARYFISTAESAMRRSLRSNILLQATAEVAQITATEFDLSRLLNKAVELIRERFDIYHAQVFLIDETREFANLIASSGEIGQRLIERQHRLAVGSKSVIGQVTGGGQPVMSGTNDANPVHARNEFLPDTRTELALPIRDGGTIIGALDVQSAEHNAFDETSVHTLQVMANQLAVSIRNARLFETQSRSADENKRLFLESETNLREIQRLNRQLTQAAWDSYLGDRSSASGVTLLGQELTQQAEWTPGMIKASQTYRPVLASDENVIAVPIVLRGEALGAIEVVPGNDTQAADLAEVIQTVAQRLAVTLDRARLFEEAQESTSHEQHVNAIVADFQKAASVEELLEITLTELSRALGAEQASIRLGSIQEQVQQNGGSAP
jgi:GAF domain-containing protein